MEFRTKQASVSKEEMKPGCIFLFRSYFSGRTEYRLITNVNNMYYTIDLKNGTESVGFVDLEDLVNFYIEDFSELRILRNATIEAEEVVLKTRY